MPHMFADIPHDAALAFPWHTTTPLGRQPQTEHLSVAPLGWRPTTGRHARCDVTLVNIVHDHVQCDKEGFEIACHSHVSFGDRVAMARDSRRNLPLVSNEQQAIC